jgi:hypothetical protein
MPGSAGDHARPSHGLDDYLIGHFSFRHAWEDAAMMQVWTD